MPIEQRQTDSTAAVVAITGRLTYGRDTAGLETLVKELCQQAGRKIVFDLSALDYTDSSGIGAVVACLTLIKKAGGELRLAGASPRIQRIFSMTGVDRLISSYPDVAAAVAG
jgi:anti-sigma B factor antagonist